MLSKDDSLYDITQALHYAKEHLIGAVGMDLDPAIGSKYQVIQRAIQLWRMLESQILSKRNLLEKLL